MKLDLRRPSIVVTGAWNPAIFQNPWIAKHLFQFPEGQQVRITNLLVTSPAPKEIVFISDVGLFVSNQRLEAYTNSDSEEVVELSEQVILRVIENLQHTPIGAMGVNFFFSEDEPSDELLDMLHVDDGLEEHHRILEQEFKATIELEDCVLNLTRSPTAETVSFNFNYHFDNLRSLEIPGAVQGVISRFKQHALDILQARYNLDTADLEVQAFEVPQEMEGENG